MTRKGQIRRDAKERSASATGEAGLTRTVRRLAIAGFSAMFLFFGILGTWASIASISGAVIADGRMVVESHSKIIQHQEGGIVKEIHVQDGDEVTAGQLLVSLDDTLSRTELAVVEKRLVSLLAKAAQLSADASGASEIGEPETWYGLQDHQDVPHLQAQEQAYLNASHAKRKLERNRLQQQRAQLEQEAAGFHAEQVSAQQQLNIARDQLKGLLSLSADGHVTRSRLAEVQTAVADLQGQIGKAATNLAATQERMQTTAVEIELIDETAKAETLKELREVDAQIFELLERRHAAGDVVRRSAIKAPHAGKVRALMVHTVRAVIGTGDPVLTIVPSNDRLVVEARVRPVDIDQVHIGQAAMVQFPGLDLKTTPQIEGKVIHIDADLTEPQGAQPPYYIARIDLDFDTLPQKEAIEMTPGLPAQVFVKTTSRTPMSYLMKPITDQLARAMRE